MNITTAIFSAINNKYGICDKDNIKEIVTSTIALLSSKSIDEIICTVSLTVDLRTDVVNQTRCYFLIENYWRRRKPEDKFIEKIYSVVFGIQQSAIFFRHKQYVKDYGGYIPEQHICIDKNLLALNIELKSIPTLNNKSLSQKALLLSEIFSGIIRTHPFEDGNGRAARMVVQYCLRYWGYHYIVIPKVRNDQKWKCALSNGINYDFTEMQLFFESTMKKDITLT